MHSKDIQLAKWEGSQHEMPQLLKPTAPGLEQPHRLRRLPLAADLQGQLGTPIEPEPSPALPLQLCDVWA